MSRSNQPERTVLQRRFESALVASLSKADEVRYASRQRLAAFDVGAAGMKLHRDHWRLRLMGVLFGIGCLGVGLLGAIGDEPAATLGQTMRFDFAIIAMVTGLIAIIGSLVSADIIGFWYCNPKRLAARRAAER